MLPVNEVRKKRLLLKNLQRRMQIWWEKWHTWDGKGDMQPLADTYQREFEEMEAEEHRLLVDIRRGWRG